MRLLTISHVKLAQSTALEQKRFDLRSLSPALRNFWLFLALSSLSNDPGKVDSNFFSYAATVLSPHRNVLIFTQTMHKPT